MSSVRKQKERKEIKEVQEVEDCRVVTKRGTPTPRFFVSMESKGLKFSRSSLESILVDGCVSMDSKGLAGAGNSGTSLLAGELTEEAGRGAVSSCETTATITSAV